MPTARHGTNSPRSLMQFAYCARATGQIWPLRIERHDLGLVFLGTPWLEFELNEKTEFDQELSFNKAKRLAVQAQSAVIYSLFFYTSFSKLSPLYCLLDNTVSRSLIDCWRANFACCRNASAEAVCCSSCNSLSAFSNSMAALQLRAWTFSSSYRQLQPSPRPRHWTNRHDQYGNVTGYAYLP
jgi:hypothetical protein